MSVGLDEMESRLVRYKELVPCTTAFIDARTPGSEKKENFTIIGPGVSENPDQHIHVPISHGFNIGGARQPKGTINSQHSHVSEEVFLVHSGKWAFRSGVNGTDGEVVLEAGDVISLPINVFRGFECLSDGDSFLFAILGGDDPGHVTWAPQVFEQAKHHGLVLTESGLLVDTSAGEMVPEGEIECVPISDAQVESFDRVDSEGLEKFVIRHGDEEGASSLSILTERAVGAKETALLGEECLNEKIGPGPIATKHGFHFRKLDLAPDASIPLHSRHEEEVVFVHQGCAVLAWEGNELTISQGDTLSIPIGLERAWSNRSVSDTVLYVVRGGDNPQAPDWVGS
jgi:quercetin dioxygenase-like cupin family protein